LPWRIFRNAIGISGTGSATSGSIFDVEAKERELAQIEEVISDPAFWTRAQESQHVLRRRRYLHRSLELSRKCGNGLEDLEVLIELEREGEDVLGDIRQQVRDLEERLSKAELNTLLSGQNDACNAIVTIHPGAGGTESQDWAQMLFRMYLRWAEKQGYKTEIVDFQEGEEAGIKSVTFLAQGDYGYGYLLGEIGVHRLVRISPYDSAARRHTSFASVFVSPEIDDTVQVVIDEKDLKIDTYRSSGSGGQHVNVTDSAVRITHLPTGIVVQCQNERSQHRNKDTAMKVLRAKIYDYEMAKRRKELDEVEDSKADIAWGSQIRSYVLHPYRLVKDHRTRIEIGNVDSVLDGGIDRFIEAYLKRRSRDKSRRGRITESGSYSIDSKGI
jgi:peptide chain release factor 2